MSNNTEVNKPAAANLSSWFLLTLIVLLPTLVVPFTLNLFGHTRLFLLLFGAIITGLLYFIQSFRTRAWKVVVSPITLPIMLFGLTVAASSFFTQNYPVENLLGMGGVYLAAALIALLGPSLINKQQASKAVTALVIGAVLVNLASLLQLFGWGPTHLINAVSAYEIEHSLVFNLTGSALVAAQLGAIALVGLIARIFKTKKIGTFEVITLPLLVFGVGLHVWSMLPGQPAEIILPPMDATWSVALDSLRVPRAAIIGQGPEGYANAFSRYRPATLNTDRLWQIRFDSAMGMPLTTLVQLGFLGLVSWLLLAVRFILKVMKKTGTSRQTQIQEEMRKSPLTWVLVAIFAMQFIFPPSYLMIGLQGILIAFWTAELSGRFATLKLHALSANLEKIDGEGHSSNLGVNSEQKHQAEKFIGLATNGAFVAGLLLLAFATSQAYASFHQLYRAEEALIDNDAVAVYERQQQAVTLNPYLDSTRRAYALTNLQIAVSLSNKTDATEEEQLQVSALIEQAVREAQAATTIDPQDSQNWAILAQIYQELIGSVEEADQWAVNAYVSAIQTSPVDPLLRIQLGSILLQQEQLQQAANLFAQATELKPDLPAGYFYLGQTQRLAQDPVSAQRSWQQALALLEPGTEDYEMLVAMLDELEPEVEQMLEAMAAQQQQFDEDGQPIPMDQLSGDGISPLGRELPSLTDQNIDRDSSVSQPGTAPLDLSEENRSLLEQTEQEEQLPEAEEEEAEME